MNMVANCVMPNLSKPRYPSNKLCVNKITKERFFDRTYNYAQNPEKNIRQKL